MTESRTAFPRIEPTARVDDVLREYPATAAVFNSFGIDVCCGGSRGVRDAAREDGVDCCALVAALEWAARDVVEETAA